MSGASKSHESAWATPKPRIRRADAEREIVNAVIDLMDQVPIPEITIQQIAVNAGVNFGYVNRYFDSRLNLLAAATDELADRVITLFRDAAEVEVKADRTTPTARTMKLVMDARAAAAPLGVKRLGLMQYLVASGVPADRFAAKSRESFESSLHTASRLGIPPHLARSNVIQAIVMVWVEVSLSPILGITPEEIVEAFSPKHDT